MVINSPTSFENSEMLINHWISYHSTFGFGSLNKTTEDANDYFDEHTLILNNANFRHYLTLPSVFVGIGILGTFVGLVVGISSFDLSSSSTIKDSISILLGGMSTAFYTSIAGMFTSIFFNLFEKYQFHSVYKKIKNLANGLNEEFRISKIELEKHQAQSQLALIQEAFGFQDEDGNFIKPNLVFSTIYRELQESTRALKSFSTDLANSIEATQAIIMEEFDQSFQKAFKETLLPVIQKLDAAVEALKNEKTSTNEHLISSTIEKLEKSMKEMIESFKEEISGNAKSELDNMLKTLSASSETLSNLPRLLNSFDESLKVTTAKFETIVEGTLERERINNVENDKRIKERNEDAQKIHSGALDVITKVTEFIEGFAEEAEKMSSSIKDYNYLIEKITETGDNLQSSSEKLSQSVQLNNEYNLRTAETNRQLTENFQKQLEEITRLNHDHLKNYELIQESITEVFKGIDEGLNNYRSHTVQTLNDYLGEFSNKLSKASIALSGSIDELNEGLDGLNEIFGKIRQ
ncbi:MotA/TolQ/ExbB proton channel family protein [Algoriphagus halophilus]|uniref:MotA/TolQ/ExbB proton channel family protein n=1 Tax=Algoriphagus halophilus TaxID=226505 RepID=UPI0013565CF1|nr:MotA/TolQ/ExbB proton channel family protein [Algoriphagus halophilus]